MRVKALCLAACLAAPLPAIAQENQDQTLADIRQELSVLYSDVRDLRGELNTTGAPESQLSGGSALERLSALEQELQRLTGKTEELEHRIDTVTEDGTNRVGDLEFRLCELEEDCDVASLGETPTLGGSAGSAGSSEASAQSGTSSGGDTSEGSFAVGEQEAFESAEAALDNGNYQGAVEQFQSYLETYPGGPKAAEAHYLRGEAYESLGQMNNAARSYLDAFSGAPDGDYAPEALFSLGRALGAIGQTQEACVTLTEVGTRFPGSAAADRAESERQSLACS